MRRSTSVVRRSLAALGVCAAPWLAGCGPRAAGRPPAMHAERAAPAATEVSDDGFASAVHDLLVSDPGSRERAMRLGAIEARQMARALAQFKAHAPERGISAVSGGLFLAHIGEAVPGMLGAQGADAIKAAVREEALRGDEGRARALYGLLFQATSEVERADAKAHIDAIDEWTRSVSASEGPVQSAGTIERAAVHRRMLEPSEAALGDAAKATTEWIARAITLRDRFRKNRTTLRPDQREEGAEAWRALATGPVVLASVYLRDADASGALAAVDRAQARELFESERPQLLAALVAAAGEPTVDRCIDLLHQLRPLTSREPSRDAEDFIEDRDVFGAAMFGVATECYRLDPTVPDVAMSVGVALAELGMAEATPAVLGDAVRAHPEARFVGESIALALEAMGSEEQAGDADAARRTFNAAQPLLAVASQKQLAGKVQPSPARVRAAMGEIELREGHLDQARALLGQSAEQEKAGGVLLRLARIEWRDGQTQGALGHLRGALDTRDASRDAALRGEILLLISDIVRGTGDVAGARTPLTEALKGLVQSRDARDGDTRARVERVLARVLDRFGAAAPAQRALERAMLAAPGDKRQATATIELLVGRAFVRGDLQAARDGLARGLAADLDNDDLVYFALWVRLLERQLHAPGDGAPDRVFASAADDGRWPSVLARFGEGKIKGDDLGARATTPIQKCEALFYAAVDKRASGDTKAGDDMLRQVLAGAGVELSEVNLARDLLDPSRAQVGSIPPDVSVP